MKKEEEGRENRGCAFSRSVSLCPTSTPPTTDSQQLSTTFCSLFLVCFLCAKVNKKKKIGKAVWSRWSFFSMKNFISGFSLSLFSFFDVEKNDDANRSIPHQKEKKNARTATSAGGPRRPGGRARLGRLPRDGPRVGPLVDDAGRLAGRPGGARLSRCPRIAFGGDGRRL